MWAVATVSDRDMKARKTKAERYMEPGMYGLLYCNPTHSFTAPFIIMSKADPSRVVADIWPEPWVLPFSIKPLGDLSRQIRGSVAAQRWPILKNRTHYANYTAAMNLTGTTVFVPVHIGDEDWRMILADLAAREVR